VSAPRGPLLAGIGLLALVLVAAVLIGAVVAGNLGDPAVVAGTDDPADLTGDAEVADPDAGAQPDGVPADAVPATVERVVDGDTLRVRLPSAPAASATSVPVRLLNIDAPELDHPTRGRDCGAAEATDVMERLVPSGTVVWLVADVEDRDRHDRPLRAVFADDGTFVNAEVVRRGWAEVVLVGPNDRFFEALLPLEEAARGEGRGAWTACDGFR
jgi:micrococcal nuclease